MIAPKIKATNTEDLSNRITGKRSKIRKKQPIYNYSKIELSDAMTKVLSRGLNF
jgi:hypothetical protein